MLSIELSANSIAPFLSRAIIHWRAVEARSCEIQWRLFLSSCEKLKKTRRFTNHPVYPTSTNHSTIHPGTMPEELDKEMTDVSGSQRSNGASSTKSSSLAKVDGIKERLTRFYNVLFDPPNERFRLFLPKQALKQGKMESICEDRFRVCAGKVVALKADRKLVVQENKKTANLIREIEKICHESAQVDKNEQIRSNFMMLQESIKLSSNAVSETLALRLSVIAKESEARDIPGRSQSSEQIEKLVHSLCREYNSSADLVRQIPAIRDEFKACGALVQEVNKAKAIVEEARMNHKGISEIISLLRDDLVAAEAKCKEQKVELEGKIGVGAKIEEYLKINAIALTDMKKKRAKLEQETKKMVANQAQIYEMHKEVLEGEQDKQQGLMECEEYYGKQLANIGSANDSLQQTIDDFEKQTAELESQIHDEKVTLQELKADLEAYEAKQQQQKELEKELAALKIARSAMKSLKRFAASNSEDGSPAAKRTPQRYKHVFRSYSHSPFVKSQKTTPQK
ncbi:girdin-like isoform X2 [Phlebotomus argentipes]|uniref:girdin-like isoform X2 n=1 Tax=Phlebotomus argentipes TaxID=94469 RepID=UPI002892E30E|nr:girdin-like isoform X2 [Phlebotomus argentipes]